MGAAPCEWEVGVSGIVCGPARGAGCAIPRQCQRLAGKEEQQGIRAPGRASRAFVACEADGNRVAVAPRA